jgi:hypothetical protein
MEETPKTIALTCRKCGGPHLTIKCGKETAKEVVPEAKKVYTDFEELESKPRKDTDRKPYQSQSDNRRPYFKTTYRVKLSGLPQDIDEEEMMHMTCDWGHIVRQKLLNYEENSVAYIDFGYEEEANYFVEAVDKTPLDYLVLSATRVSSEDPHNKRQTKE